MILEILKAIVLGIVQGITEWLPISSTGHLILVDEFIHLQFSENFINLFMVVIQLGSILAVVLLYFERLNPFSFHKTPKQRNETMHLWFKVVVAAVPGAVAGLFLDDWISSVFYGPVPVAVALIVYGILFILIEMRHKKPRVDSIGKLSYRRALGIGLCQMLALIPGTSRSGSTILGAVMLGTSRSVAAEFSFFLAIPMMLGASGLKLIKYGLLGFTFEEIVVLLVGTLVSFIVSVFAIKFLMGYIKKHDFKAFGYYRIVLGIVVLLYFWLVG